MPLELIEGKREEYDKQKDREMLLEAAETVLGYEGVNLHKNCFIPAFMIFTFRFDDVTFVKNVQQFQNLQSFSRCLLVAAVYCLL
jgi:hypothetical protein